MPSCLDLLQIAGYKLSQAAIKIAKKEVLECPDVNSSFSLKENTFAPCPLPRVERCARKRQLDGATGAILQFLAANSSQQVSCSSLHFR